MRFISFKQVIVVLIILFFLFGDLKRLKKKIYGYVKKINSFVLKKK